MGKKQEMEIPARATQAKLIVTCEIIVRLSFLSVAESYLKPYILYNTNILILILIITQFNATTADWVRFEICLSHKLTLGQLVMRKCLAIYWHYV